MNWVEYLLLLFCGIVYGELKLDLLEGLIELCTEPIWSWVCFCFCFILFVCLFVCFVVVGRLSMAAPISLGDIALFRSLT